MNRFFVGQRVRILWSLDYPELNSTIGTIASEPYEGMDARGVFAIGYEVAPDAWGTVRSPRGLRFCPQPSQLAPLYDGNSLVSWETCAWRPNADAIQAAVEFTEDQP